MRSVVSFRDPLDAFERDHPELSGEDIQFLNRLRSERFAEQKAEAWRYIRTADVRVIECAVKALRVAKALPNVRTETDKIKRELAAAKNAVRVVRKHFAKDHRTEALNLQRGLAWAEKNIESHEDLCSLDLLGDAGFTVALNSKELPTISRKHKTLARKTFMVQVRQAMFDIFGAPRDRAVAALTTVAFEIDTSIDDVRNAWRQDRSIRRKI